VPDSRSSLMLGRSASDSNVSVDQRGRLIMRKREIDDVASALRALQAQGTGVDLLGSPTLRQWATAPACRAQWQGREGASGLPRRVTPSSAVSIGHSGVQVPRSSSAMPNRARGH
jgi:hypothetical protein